MLNLVHYLSDEPFVVDQIRLKFRAIGLESFLDD